MPAKSRRPRSCTISTGRGVVGNEVDIKLEPLELATVEAGDDAVAEPAVWALSCDRPRLADLEHEVILEIEIDDCFQCGGEQVTLTPPCRVGVPSGSGIPSDTSDHRKPTLERPHVRRRHLDETGKQPLVRRLLSQPVERHASLDGVSFESGFQRNPKTPSVAVPAEGRHADASAAARTLWPSSCPWIRRRSRVRVVSPVASATRAARSARSGSDRCATSTRVRSTVVTGTASRTVRSSSSSGAR